MMFFHGRTLAGRVAALVLALAALVPSRASAQPTHWQVGAAPVAQAPAPTATATPTPTPTPTPAANSTAANSIVPLSKAMRFEVDRKHPSPSGHHHLVEQRDGNLVVDTRQDQPVCPPNSLASNRRSNGCSAFQTDGNLATCRSNDTDVWSARPVASPTGTTLSLDRQGELQPVAPGGDVLWTGAAN